MVEAVGRSTVSEQADTCFRSSEGVGMTVQFEIHPSIGISRVGPSEQFFLGPEPNVAPPTRYRDESGKLLRQAARFRVFECERDDEGQLVRATEVRPERARIE